MKDFFKTIGLAIGYDLLGNVLYLLLMILFGWMAHWWWIFIIVFGVGSISVLIGFGSFIAIPIAFFTNKWYGKLLAVLISIHLLYFSIHAVWTTDFIAEYSKEITVKILATIVFLAIFLPAAFVSFAPKNENTLQ